MGDTERAHRDLLWIVRERPGDGQASRSLRILMEAREGDPLEEKLAFLRGLYAHVGESDLGDDILNYEADLLAESGDRQGAARALRQLVREHPYPRGQRWDDALWQLADIAEENHEYRRAIGYLREMVQPQELTVTPGSQTLPRMPEAQLRIARIYRDHLHDPVHAAENFRLVHDRFPTCTLRDDALYELGVMWIEGGQREQGCSMLSQVAREFEVGHARRMASRRIHEACGR
jgi:TolA-binding protein